MRVLCSLDYMRRHYAFDLLRPSDAYTDIASDNVNQTLRGILQWNAIWISIVFIQENAIENVVCEMAAVLSHIITWLAVHCFDIFFDIYIMCWYYLYLLWRYVKTFRYGLKYNKNDF